MNGVDVLIVVLVGLAVAIGLRQGLVRQVCTAASSIGALFVAALLYHKLAFLTESSGLRVVILLILTIAAALLSYDLLLVAAERLRKTFHRARRLPVLMDRLGGGIVAAMSTLIIVLVASAMFGRSLPSYAQGQISGSGIIAAMQGIGRVPGIFTAVSYVLQPFRPPQVFVGTEPNLRTEESAVTEEYAALDSVTTKATTSVVKVEAWGCGTTAIGTGFVAADQTVVTNAHVVAGASRLSIKDGAGHYSAQAIWFDPKLDIAVLTTNENLRGAPLSLAARQLPPGTIAAFLGYGGNQLATGDAIILQVLTAQGYDIYGKNEVTRTIYAFRSTVTPGDSGGPLIAKEGSVVGLVFGHSTTYSKTGYAITAGQIAPVLEKALAANEPLSTGSCGS